MNLLIDQQSRECRQRLGSQAWVALEYLALAAKPEEDGWTAPVGVRDVAIGLGVTKDTAARAVRALVHARLVDPITTVGANGRKRRGYRINLPEGVSIRDCPADRDAVTVAPSELIVPTVADAGSRHGTAAPGTDRLATPSAPTPQPSGVEPKPVVSTEGEDGAAALQAQLFDLTKGVSVHD